VVEFNDYFKALITDRRKEVSDQRIAYLTSSNVSSPLRFHEDLLTIQLICDSANNVYEQMVRDGLWSSTVKSNNLPASQVLITSTLTCFNCGKQHHIRDCSEPLNIQLVSQNKTKFRQQKSSGNTTSQNMPAPNRGNNRNQRVTGAGTSNSANQRIQQTNAPSLPRSVPLPGSPSLNGGNLTTTRQGALSPPKITMRHFALKWQTFSANYTLNARL
jgi:hypothetical protein